MGAEELFRSLLPLHGLAGLALSRQPLGVGCQCLPAITVRGRVRHQVLKCLEAPHGVVALAVQVQQTGMDAGGNPVVGMLFAVGALREFGGLLQR